MNRSLFDPNLGDDLDLRGLLAEMQEWVANPDHSPDDRNEVVAMIEVVRHLASEVDEGSPPSSQSAPCAGTRESRLNKPAIGDQGGIKTGIKAASDDRPTGLGMHAEPLQVKPDGHRLVETAGPPRIPLRRHSRHVAAAGQSQGGR